MQEAKLIALSLFLTALIWFSADQLQNNTEEVGVTVRLGDLKSAELVLQSPLPSQPFIATVVGPKKITSRLKAAEPIKVTLRPPAPGPSLQRLDMADALRLVPDSPFTGVTIQQVAPPALELQFDRIVHEKVRVVPLPGTLDCEGAPRSDPEFVTVSLPQRVLESIPPEARKIELPVEDYFRSQPKGEPLIMQIPLPQELAGKPVKFNPSAVAVQTTLHSRTRTATLTAVPIIFAGSIAILNDYKFQLKDASTPLLTQTIQVRGPIDTIFALEKRQIKISGQILITSDDIVYAGEFIRREPVFTLPQDVELSADPEEVQFRLVKR